MKSKQVSNMLDINMRLINKITDIAIAEEKKFEAMPKDHPNYEWEDQEDIGGYLTSAQTHLEKAQWELDQLDNKLREKEAHE